MSTEQHGQGSASSSLKDDGFRSALMLRRTLSILLVIASFAVCVRASRKTAADPGFARIDSIVRTLSDISGLSENHPVPYGRMSKAQLRRFLAKRIKKTLKSGEIYADELSLKMFGLVPQDYDLRKSTIDLLTEQAAAFYDYDAKKLFLLEDTSLEEETTTLAHELAHALADQHFNLDKFMDESPASDDENLAHTAVVEGEASWLMIAYDLKEQGQPAVPSPEMLKSVVDAGSDSMADYPVLKGSPLYIQQSLLFPYTEGTLFFDVVYKRMKQRAFAAVFEEPPVDSAQVIHPDRYFAHEKPAKPEVIAPRLNAKQKEITEGSVGEFDHQMLLTEYISEAESKAIAPHLRGGEYKIFAVGKERKPLLDYISEWDSAQHAADFFADYKKILQRKWRHCDATISEAAIFAGTGDNGYFVVRLNSNSVVSIEGLSGMEDWKRLKASTNAASDREMRVEGKSNGP